MRQCLLEGLGNDVAGFVDVAQAMRFIEDNQVPVDAHDIFSLGLCELVGTDDRAGGELERVAPLLLADRVVALGFQNKPLQAKLVLQLLMPLFAQVGRDDDEDLPLPFCPALGYDQAGFDRLAQANLVGKDHATRKWVAAGEEGSIDLMRVEIDLRIDQSRSQRLYGVTRRTAGEYPRHVLALIRRQ